MVRSGLRLWIGRSAPAGSRCAPSTGGSAAPPGPGGRSRRYGAPATDRGPRAPQKPGAGSVRARPRCRPSARTAAKAKRRRGWRRAWAVPRFPFTLGHRSSLGESRAGAIQTAPVLPCCCRSPPGSARTALQVPSANAQPQVREGNAAQKFEPGAAHRCLLGVRLARSRGEAGAGQFLFQFFPGVEQGPSGSSKVNSGFTRLVGC